MPVSFVNTHHGARFIPGTACDLPTRDKSGAMNGALTGEALPDLFLHKHNRAPTGEKECWFHSFTRIIGSVHLRDGSLTAKP